VRRSALPQDGFSNLSGKPADRNDLCTQILFRQFEVRNPNPDREPNRRRALLRVIPSF
jgi:hypothetical protein